MRGVLNPLAAWLGRLRRRPRARELDRLYREHLHERPRSPEERVRHHLDLLDEYWSRCLGILDVGPRPATADFLASDFVLLLLAASRIAAADVNGYARRHADPTLRDAWRVYERSLKRARRGLPGVETALRRAAADFAEVHRRAGPAGFAA